MQARCRGAQLGGATSHGDCGTLRASRAGAVDERDFRPTLRRLARVARQRQSRRVRSGPTRTQRATCGASWRTGTTGGSRARRPRGRRHLVVEYASAAQRCADRGHRVPCLDVQGPRRFGWTCSERTKSAGLGLYITRRGAGSPARRPLAPSPTGELHIGNLRTALVAWLYARSTSSRFLMRVEDLDVGRVRERFVGSQLDDLRAIGIDWDGEPVRQSARTAGYRAALDRLAADGRVYRCFCSRREIREAASAQHGEPAGRYPGTCARLSAAESDRRADAGEPHALRLRAGGAEVEAGGPPPRPDPRRRRRPRPRPPRRRLRLQPRRRRRRRRDGHRRGRPRRRPDRLDARPGAALRPPRPRAPRVVARAADPRRRRRATREAARLGDARRPRGARDRARGGRSASSDARSGSSSPGSRPRAATACSSASRRPICRASRSSCPTAGRRSAPEPDSERDSKNFSKPGLRVFGRRVFVDQLGPTRLWHRRGPGFPPTRALAISRGREARLDGRRPAVPYA